MCSGCWACAWPAGAAEFAGRWLQFAPPVRELAIVGTIVMQMGLLMPGLIAARENARRTQCASIAVKLHPANLLSHRIQRYKMGAILTTSFRRLLSA